MTTVPIEQAKQGEPKPVKGIRKKRNAGRSLLKSFLEEDAKNAVSYIMWEIVVPSAKSLLHDIMDRGSARLLWGDGGYSAPRYNSYGRNDNRPYVNYSSRPLRQMESESRANRQRRNQTSVFVDDIYLDSVRDMEEFDARLHYLLDNQGFIRVSDYYEAAHLESNYIDRRWGWYDIRAMTKIKEGDMWLISMPLPEELNEAR